MNFKSILFVGLVFTLISVDLCGQEVDYTSLKTGDSISTGYVRIIDNSPRTEQNIKVLYLLESGDPMAKVNKTVVISEGSVQEFETRTQIIYNWDIIITQDENFEVRIYSPKWKLYGKINFYDYVEEDFYVADIRLVLLENNLFLVYGNEMFMFDINGNLIFKQENIFSGKSPINNLKVFKLNEEMFLVHYESFSNRHEIYKVNIASQKIEKGPDIHNISKKYNLGLPTDIYYSNLSGYIIINFGPQWCITNFNESFVSIPEEKLGYSFMHYNPMISEDKKRILLYNHNKYVDLIRVYDLDSGLIEEEININDFFSNYIQEKITRIEYIQERQNYYFIAVNTKDFTSNQENKVLLKFPNDALTKANYQKLENAEVLEFKSKEDLIKFYITKEIKE